MTVTQSARRHGRLDASGEEYASQGKVVATGGPYSNRYISVITLTDRKISHWRDHLDPLRVITALNAQH